VNAHGTNARYQDRCRCLPCRIAHYDYQVEYREGGRRRVPAGPTLRRIDKLLDAGLTQREIERRAGMCARSLWKIRKQTRVHRDTRDAVMGVAR